MTKLSAAEKQRRYRARRDADPQRRVTYRYLDIPAATFLIHAAQSSKHRSGTFLQ